MDFLQVVTEAGFPVACAFALSWFSIYMVKQSKAEHEKSLQYVTSTSEKREDILMEEIRKTREINEKAVNTIAEYANKLKDIQDDIHDIKNDIDMLTKKAA